MKPPSTFGAPRVERQHGGRAQERLLDRDLQNAIVGVGRSLLAKSSSGRVGSPIDRRATAEWRHWEGRYASCPHRGRLR